MVAYEWIKEEVVTVLYKIILDQRQESLYLSIMSKLGFPDEPLGLFLVNYHLVVSVAEIVAPQSPGHLEHSYCHGEYT